MRSREKRKLPAAPVGAQPSRSFFCGIHDSGDPVVVDELASDDFAISDSIFKEIYGKLTLRGRGHVKKLCASYSRRWIDQTLSIREVAAEGERVAMAWSFEARLAVAERGAPTKLVQWTGISVFRVNDDGKIEQESGLESALGPFSRLLADELTSEDKGT